MSPSLVNAPLIFTAIRGCGQKTNIIGRFRPHKSLILLPMWHLHPCVMYEACKMQQPLSLFFHLHLPTPTPFPRSKFFPIKVEPYLEGFHHLRNTNRKSQKLSPIDKKKTEKDGSISQHHKYYVVEIVSKFLLSLPYI